MTYVQPVVPAAMPDQSTLPAHDDAAWPRATRGARSGWLLRNLLRAGAAATYAAFAVAIVWGGEPGSPLAGLTGAITGAWSFAAAVALLVGGVSLLDEDTAPVASAVLSVAMSSMLTFAPLTPGLRLVVVVLLVAALPIAWVTRRERLGPAARASAAGEPA